MRKWIKPVCLSLLAAGVIVLLYFVEQAQQESIVAKPDIVIHVDGENAFITQDELYARLKTKGFFTPGKKHAALDVQKIETYIREMSEVKQVKVFTRLGDTWEIDIVMRKPIARIFNAHNETFYLDEDGFKMQISDLHTARVVVVSGNIPDRLDKENVTEIINNDSLKSIRKLDDVYRISNYVCKDPFLQSLVGQIHLKKSGDFVLIPLVGGQKIIFGSAQTDEEVKAKFEKLAIFYKEAIPYEGWNKYDEISLKYGSQIVCKKADGYVEEVNVK
jgi:cell division protein FtsQ